jgi:hypothetical protein
VFVTLITQFRLTAVITYFTACNLTVYVLLRHNSHLLKVILYNKFKSKELSDQILRCGEYKYELRRKLDCCKI